MQRGQRRRNNSSQLAVRKVECLQYSAGHMHTTTVLLVQSSSSYSVMGYVVLEYCMYVALWLIPFHYTVMLLFRMIHSNFAIRRANYSKKIATHTHVLRYEQVTEPTTNDEPSTGGDHRLGSYGTSRHVSKQHRHPTNQPNNQRTHTHTRTHARKPAHTRTRTHAP